MASILRPGLNSMFRPLKPINMYKAQTQTLFRPNLFRKIHTPVWPNAHQNSPIGLHGLLTKGALRRGMVVGATTASILGLGLAMSPNLFTEPSPPAVPFPVASPPSSSPTPAVAQLTPASSPPPPPPKSAVNLYELSFGTVCGICAGVFVKKGAKALAFFLGGVFVLLQYFTSFGFVKVDWSKMGSRFERTFHSQPTAPGQPSKPPTVYKLWLWLVDFLTADFPPRATFIAGFALGLRIG